MLFTEITFFTNEEFFEDFFNIVSFNRMIPEARYYFIPTFLTKNFCNSSMSLYLVSGRTGPLTPTRLLWPWAKDERSSMYFHFHQCWYGKSCAPDSTQSAHITFQATADSIPFLLCILAQTHADSLNKSLYSRHQWIADEGDNRPEIQI